MIERVWVEYLSKAYWKNRCYTKTKKDELNLEKSYDLLVIFFDAEVKESYIYTKVNDITLGRGSQFNLAFNFDEEKGFDHIITKDEALNIILPQRI